MKSRTRFNIYSLNSQLRSIHLKPELQFWKVFIMVKLRAVIIELIRLLIERLIQTNDTICRGLLRAKLIYDASPGYLDK